MKLLTLVLGIIIIVCIILPILQTNIFGIQDTFEPSAIPTTTDTETLSMTILDVLRKNQKDQESFEQFIIALKQKGVNNPKIDTKFYNTLVQAYANQLLTRDFIVNRLI